jgi:hypothetical protein
MEELRNACRVLNGKPERPLGTHRCSREDIIKMVLKLWQYELDLSDSGQSPCSIKCLEILE